MTLNKLFGALFTKEEASIAKFKKEIGVSRHIPLTHFSQPHIFSTRNGSMGFVIKLAGLPFEVTGNEDLNYLQHQWAFSLKNLRDEFAIYQTIYRHAAAINLKGKYPEGFSQTFSTAYQQQFLNKSLYLNDIYLTFILKSHVLPFHKGLSFLAKFQSSAQLSAFQEYQESQIRKIEHTINQLMQTLHPYAPELLGTKEVQKNPEENPSMHSELLSFFSILVNGEPRSFLMPYEDIASFLPQKRLFFGENALHFQGISRGKDQFAAILSIKEYYPKNVTGLFNGLLALPFSTINTHSYRGIKKNEALESIRRQRAKFISVGDKSRSQIAELDEAADDVASDRINFGFHHNTLLIFGESLEDLEDKTAKAAKVYEDVGIVAIRETLNLENAFWAQIPGNFKYIRRQSLVSSHNFSCFCSLHNFYTGYLEGNHLGSPIMLAETRSKTPFYFNLHEKASGRKEDLPKGHTTMIAPSNAGKTVVMMAVNTMMQKYGIRSFIFDRNRGCDIYVRAMGGQYCILNANEPTGWNPCQLEDTPQNREFLREWLKQLVKRPDIILTAEDENQIADVISRNFTLPFEKRNLSNLSSFFRLDFTGLSSLSRWLRLKDRTGRSGEYAWIFDNETDTLNLNTQTMGFDMTALLGSEQDENKDFLTPVMMYLFKRIEMSLDGTLTGIYLDEGWQFLRNTYWVQKLDEYFVTWRKENAFIFFATQLPEKVANSPLASALIQGSATLIFLPNPRAQEKDYLEAFKLTRKEFDFIKTSAIQARYFLIKQGNESAIMRFNLNGMANLTAVLSGNKLTLPICESVRQQYGEHPQAWLPAFYERVKQL